jgi:uncharacterized protein (TIGR03437 family)
LLALKSTGEKSVGLKTIAIPVTVAIALLLFVAAGTLLGQEQPITITTTSLPNATVGLQYLTSQGNTVQLTAAGGYGGPYSWSYSLTPSTYNPIYSSTLTTDGLTFSSDGTIIGIPTAPELLSFGVRVADQEEDPTTGTLEILISACLPTILPASPLPTGEVSVPYTGVTFIASGCSGTYTYTAQATQGSTTILPPGLSLSSAGGLSGKPTAAGTYNFIIVASDENKNATPSQFSLTIKTAPTITTASSLPNGLMGQPYSEQIAATGGTPPYTFSIGSPPPGITVTSGGVLQGTPTQTGLFNFTLSVTDSLMAETTSDFQVSFASPVSQIQVTPLSLTFNANLNGTPPPTQAVSVVPATGATPPVNFHLIVDDGQSGSAAPSWITVTPASGIAPAGLVVGVNQMNLASGPYTARIQVLDNNGMATDVIVTLNVASVNQELTVAPAILNFAARAAAPGVFNENLVVSNRGAGTLAFTTSVLGNSSWISSVTSSANTTSMSAPVFVQVQVNTHGLQIGAYNDVIVVSSSAGNTQVPVALFVGSSGPILGLDTTGVLFQPIAGGGSTATRQVQIYNLGDPSSTVNWTAALQSGSNWLTLASSSGTATTSSPGVLTLALVPNATQLTPGPYYALVSIADSNSLNSPQYVTAVLNVQPNTAAPSPDLAPGGLFFTTALEGSSPPPQQVVVNTSASTTVTFNAAVTTLDNGAWLSVTPLTGSASGQTAGAISVSVNPGGLAAGIYSGDVNISIGLQLESVNVTFVVQPTGLADAVPSVRPHVVLCTPTKLAMTEIGLVNHFAIPAEWPATLIVQLNDDCANPVTNGSVIASFSNGDQADNLAGNSLGYYSTTWQPGGVNSNMVVTFNATAGTLQPAMAQLYGGVGANQTPPPTVAPGGTLNNFNPVVGAPLAPGTITQVYGTGLASSSTSTGKLPLPTFFNNTFALIGPAQAPLYFLSSGQINLQLPNQANQAQQLPLVLSVNNALTIPVMLDIVPGAPGVLSADDGPTPPYTQNGAHIVAQHSADYSLVSSSSPAVPGEYLVIYLVGLGATDPAVAAGVPAPGPPTLANVTVPPTVTVGSLPAKVAFAGLTPGYVGLYQIDFQVPAGAPSGESEVDVIQNGVAANPTLLPISN